MAAFRLSTPSVTSMTTPTRLFLSLRSSRICKIHDNAHILVLKSYITDKIAWDERTTSLLSIMLYPLANGKNIFTIAQNRR
jgi:hypothetical protein